MNADETTVGAKNLSPEGWNGVQRIAVQVYIEAEGLQTLDRGSTPCRDDNDARHACML